MKEFPDEASDGAIVGKDDVKDEMVAELLVRRGVEIEDVHGGTAERLTESIDQASQGVFTVSDTILLHRQRELHVQVKLAAASTWNHFIEMPAERGRCSRWNKKKYNDQSVSPPHRLPRSDELPHGLRVAGDEGPATIRVELSGEDPQTPFTPFVVRESHLDRRVLGLRPGQLE